MLYFVFSRIYPTFEYIEYTKRIFRLKNMLQERKMKTKSYCLRRNCCCCTVRNELQAFPAFVLNSVTDSIVRLRVLKFSAAAFIALTVSWLLIRTALTMFSVISFDFLINSSVYCGV